MISQNILKNISVSIDCWNTLLKGSPEFKEYKCNLIRRFFDPVLKNSTIHNKFSYVKKNLNYVIENTGWMPEQLLMYKLLFAELGYKNATNSVTNTFIEEYQKLAIKYLPDLYSTETREYLEALSKFELSLISNTLFLTGETLEKIFEKLDIKKYFNKLIFSDQFGYSKPNIQIYNSKYHIGDSKKTDVEGAFTASSIPILINNNNKHNEENKTIKDAYFFILKRECLL